MGGLVPTPSRRRPVVLSEPQERVATLLAALPESEGFALAGGAAPIVRRLVDRTTHDLDFFTTRSEDVDRLLPALERALANDGLDVERVQVNAGFARLAVTAGDARTEVDLCVDHRLTDPEQSELGPILALD